jgi:tetratricopeptide (TPR) repeat protein
MSQKEKFDENINEAVKWLATEHNFFLELKNDLAQIKKAVEIAMYETSVKEVKKVLHDINYWGKSERRFHKYFTNARSLARKLKEKVEFPATRRQELSLLIKQLDVEAAHLIRDCSRYEGRLHELFEHLDQVLQEKDFEQAQQIIMELQMTSQDAEKWIEALSADLNKAKKLAEDFSEVYHESIEGIKQVIAPLTIGAKTEYLFHLLKQGKAMKKETRKDILKILEEYYELDHLVNQLKNDGLFEEAGDLYVRMNASKGIYHVNLMEMAIDCYAKGKIYEKLGDLLVGEKRRNKDYFGAAEAYEKVKLFSKALEMYGKKSIEDLEMYRKNSINISKKDTDWNIFNPSRLKITETSFTKALHLSKALRENKKHRGFLIRFAEYWIIFSNASHYKIKTGDFGSTYWKKGRKVWATTYIKKGYKLLIEAGFSEKKAWKIIAECHQNAELAAQAYEKAEEWLLAAERWEKAGDKDKARKLLEKTQKKKGTKTEQLIDKGDILFSQDNYKGALTIYEKAKAWDKMAECYNLLGKGVKAIQMYKKSAKEFEKKFGFDKIKKADLDPSLEIGVLLENLKKATRKDELTKVLQEIIKKVGIEDDASAIIITLQDIPLTSENHWRMLAKSFETTGLYPHSAECSIHAGKLDDLKRAAEQYRKIKEKGLASMVVVG